MGLKLSGARREKRQGSSETESAEAPVGTAHSSAAEANKVTVEECLAVLNDIRVRGIHQARHLVERAHNCGQL